ncbi:hypothetical protein ACHWQZ_G003194 [Mnemiopsis leidyi]
MSRLGVGNKFWVYERPRLTSEDRWKSKFVLKGLTYHNPSECPSITVESESSARKLAEVVNDEVGDTDLKKHLDTQKGLNDFSHLPTDQAEVVSTGSRTVLVKTVKQMQKATEISNKVRFLGFHKTVQDAAAECRAKKFGEKLKFLRSRKRVLELKEKSRRAELGLSNIKLPKRELSRKSELDHLAAKDLKKNRKQFIKICQPIQYSVRPALTPDPEQFNVTRKDGSFQTLRKRLLKKNCTFYGTKIAGYPKSIPLSPTSSATSSTKGKLSYSRFLCKELGATSVGLKKAIKSNTNYVPIHLYDKPAHSRSGTVARHFSISNNCFKFSHKFPGWWKQARNMRSDGDAY